MVETKMFNGLVYKAVCTGIKAVVEPEQKRWQGKGYSTRIVREGRYRTLYVCKQ